MEKIYDRVVNSTPNFVKNQKETILWITKPPAKESIAKRPDSVVTISFDFGDRVCLNSLGVSCRGIHIPINLYSVWDYKVDP
jgi:hypothetical protein